MVIYKGSKKWNPVAFMLVVGFTIAGFAGSGECQFASDQPSEPVDIHRLGSVLPIDCPGLDYTEVVDNRRDARYVCGGKLRCDASDDEREAATKQCKELLKSLQKNRDHVLPLIHEGDIKRLNSCEDFIQHRLDIMHCKKAAVDECADEICKRTQVPEQGPYCYIAEPADKWDAQIPKGEPNVEWVFPKDNDPMCKFVVFDFYYKTGKILGLASVECGGCVHN